MQHITGIIRKKREEIQRRIQTRDTNNKSVNEYSEVMARTGSLSQTCRTAGKEVAERLTPQSTKRYKASLRNLFIQAREPSAKNPRPGLTAIREFSEKYAPGKELKQKELQILHPWYQLRSIIRVLTNRHLQSMMLPMRNVFHDLIQENRIYLRESSGYRPPNAVIEAFQGIPSWPVSFSPKLKDRYGITQIDQMEGLLRILFKESCDVIVSLWRKECKDSTSYQYCDKVLRLKRTQTPLDMVIIQGISSGTGFALDSLFILLRKLDSEGIDIAGIPDKKLDVILEKHAEFIFSVSNINISTFSIIEQVFAKKYSEEISKFILDLVSSHGQDTREIAALFESGQAKLLDPKFFCIHQIEYPDLGLVPLLDFDTRMISQKNRKHLRTSSTVLGCPAGIVNKILIPWIVKVFRETVIDPFYRNNQR